MALITENKLQATLDPSSAAKEPDQNMTVSYSNKGPGDLDKWASLLEGKDNCWQQRDNKNKQQQPHKKIIISSAMLCQRAPSEEIQALIDGLTQNYEVYLWPGSHVNFDTLKPILNTTEFWEKRASAVIDDQNEIQKALSTQGIATDNYHFLDDTVSFNLLEDLNKKYELLLQTTSPKSIDYNYLNDYPVAEVNRQITAIDISTQNNDLGHEVAKYPHLKDIHIRKLDEETVDKSLSLLKQKNLNLRLTDPKLSQFHYKEQDFNELNIEESDHLIELTLDEDNHLEHTDSAVKRKLSLLRCNNLKNLIISPQINLHTLSISACPIQFDATQIPEKLKNLELIQIPLAEFIVPENNQLEELYLASSEELHFVDLRSCNHLKKLTLPPFSAQSQILLPDLNQIEELNIYSFHQTNIDNLDFNKLKNVKKLHLRSISNLTWLDLTKLPALEELTIEECSLTQSIDLNNLKKLKKFTLLDCSFLNEDVNAISCNNHPTITTVQIGRLKNSKIVINDCKNLATLNIEQCKKLQLFECTNNNLLTEIKIDKKSIPQKMVLNNCQSITKLNYEAINSADFKLSDFPDLTEIHTKINDDVKFDHLNALSKLEKIDLDDYSNINNFDLSHFKSLTSIRLLRRGDTKDITIVNENILDNLHISSYHSIELKQCKLIRKLNILECGFSTFNNFDANVQELEIGHCYNLKDCNLKGLTTLKRLSIQSCKQSEQKLALSELEELEINNCGDLKLLDLTQCPKLKRLKIANCKQLDSLDLSKLPQLEILQIETCQGIKQINLPTQSQLKSFTLIGDTNYAPTNPDIDSLDNCTHLEQIYLNYCRLHKLSLQNMQQLKKLIINDSLIDSIKLNGDSNLSQLILTTTKDAPRTSINLSKCDALKLLYINQSYVDIKGIEDCKALENVNFSIQDLDEIEDLISTLPTSCHQFTKCRPFDDYKPPSDEERSIDDNELHESNIQEAAISENTNPSNNSLDDKEAQTIYQQQFKNLFNPHSSFDKNSYTGILNRHHNNESSLVSRFEMESFDGVDSDTKAAALPYQAKGSFTVEYITKNTPAKDHYRILIRDSIKYENGKIIFTSNIENKLNSEPIICKDITQEKLLALINETKNNYFANACYFKGRLIPGEIYPLTSLNAMPKNLNNQVYSAMHDKINIFWHDDHQQFYVKLKPEIKQSTAVEILHLSDNDILYQQLPDPQNNIAPEIVSRNELLPAEIINILDKELIKFRGLTFLFNEDLNPREKLDLLIEYCSHFKNEALTAQPPTDIDAILDCLWEQKGVCRHRSQAFLLLARYIGIPARMICNEQHVFCEVSMPHSDDASWDHKRWHLIDLGGAPQLDITPENMRESVLNKLKKPTPNKSADDLARLDKQAQYQLTVAKYSANFDKLVEKSEAGSVTNILQDKTGLAPLIEITDKQSSFDINKQIITQLQTSGFNTQQNYLYINSADDFKLLLAPYRLKDGAREQIAGPLQKLIDAGGIIAVNWANFNHTELASYKSILDKPPTLLGKNVSPNLTIIGITQENSDACTAFSSRCKTYHVNEGFFKETPKETTATLSDKPPVPVDLFESINWKEKLLGQIKLTGDQIILTDGPLLQAIQEKRGIQIFNPPRNNSEFSLLLHRLATERQFLYNGELRSIPNEFTVTTATKQHANNLANVAVKLEDETTLGDKRSKIYLGLYNIHECLEQLIIDKDHKADTPPGFLKQYDNNTQVFYITESIPRSDWQYLLAKIAEGYPNKQFEFIVAPDVEIEGVIKNTNSVAASSIKPTELKVQQSGVMLSNDPHYLTQQLVKQYKQNNKEPIKIDLTPQSDFTHLIAEMSLTRDKDSHKITFNYQEKQILTALIKGETVILNGEMSHSLYQQLLPLFSKSGHIYCNGKQYVTTGQLISIQPLSAKKSLPLMPYQECNYTREDYQKEFTADDAHFVAQIFQFYDYAAQLPHKGMGRPTSAELSFDRLKKMVHLLKTKPLHAQNPIKGVFHYDYIIGSEDYYYLNVVAKYLFSSQKAGKFREQKLKDILALHNIKKLEDLKPEFWNHNSWKILNCFSGASIKEILGDDLTNALNMKSGYPKLNQAQLNLLQEKLTPHLAAAFENVNPLQETKQSHVAKRERQLSQLLTDDSTNIIVLKGPPGVGKTHTIRAVLNITDDVTEAQIYEGEKGIIAWLEKGDKILLLDEANLAVPGTWDFLAGVQRGDKTLYYQGKAYDRKPQHQKIIATINPENYPKREYHRILQHQAETVRFDMPENNFLEKHVLGHLLSPFNLNESRLTQGMLRAYQFIRDANPTYVFSNRDLASLALRFAAICDNEKDPDKQLIALWRACVGEFAGTLIDPDVRARFTSRVANEFKIDHTLIPQQTEFIVLTEKCKIHPEKAAFIESLEQDLLLRNQLIKTSGITSQINSTDYKCGILIEGDAGLGKSTLLQGLLEKNGFSQHAEDSQKRYYVISAGDEKNVTQLLLKAFHEGAAVILDEINLDESLEKLLNQLLSGVDLEGKTADKSGFMIFASQNPSYFAGRQSVSQAMRNRMHMVYMDAYSKPALIDIAKTANIAEPEAFVDAFLSCKKANMRTFYTLLNSDYIPKISVAKSAEDKQIVTKPITEAQLQKALENISLIEQTNVDKPQLRIKDIMPVDKQKKHDSNAIVNEKAPQKSR